MEYHKIICLVTLGFYILILALQPVRIKAILKKAGKQVLQLSKKSPVLSVFVVILGFVLAGILYFKELGIITDVIIALTALTGSFMCTSDALLSSKNGLYKNGIINGSRFLPLSEIYSLPLLSYTKEEQEELKSSVLKIVTEKSGTINMIFASEDECSAVIRKLIQLKPELKI